jgi:WD40 repeat protein
MQCVEPDYGVGFGDNTTLSVRVVCRSRENDKDLQRYQRREFMSVRKPINRRVFVLSIFIGATAGLLGIIPALLAGWWNSFEIVVFSCLTLIGSVFLGGILGGCLCFYLQHKSVQRWKVLLGAAAVGLLFPVGAGIYQISLKIQSNQREQIFNASATQSVILIPTLKAPFEELFQVNTLAAMAVSPDGRYLAYAPLFPDDDADRIHLWDLKNKRALENRFLGNSSPISLLEFSPDGHTLLVGGSDHNLQVWQVPSGEEAFELTGHQDIIYCAAVSHDGALAATEDGDGKVILWDLVNGRKAAQPSIGRFMTISCDLDFSPDGKLLAFTSNKSDDDEEIIIWDIALGQPVGFLAKPGTFSVGGIAFSPDGKSLTGIDYENVYLWDVKKLNLVVTIPGPAQSAFLDSFAGFSPDGRWIFATDHSVIYQFDPAGLETIKRLTDPYSYSLIEDIYFLADGRLVVSYWHENGPTGIGIWTLGGE